MVSQVDLESGRVKQKLRTRNALVGAAWELLREGRQPTIDEVADAADISRATAYRYFPNRERLLIEAVLSREADTPESVLERVGSRSGSDRVARIQEYMYDLVGKNETLHRSLLRACQEEWMNNKNRFVLRGHQRLLLLESVLKSTGGDIQDEKIDKLIYALATMVSVESYVVLRDVCQVSQSRGREIMNWAVRKLVEAALAEEGK